MVIGETCRPAKVKVPVVASIPLCPSVSENTTVGRRLLVHVPGEG